MKTQSKRLISLVLVMAIVVSLFSVMFTSAAADGTSAGGVHLDKKATLEDNGTYTVDLSGFVTGQSTTSQYTSYAPLDVILVLDASSSMLQYPNPVSGYHAALVDTKYSVTGYSYSGEKYPADATSETNLATVFTARKKYFNSTDTSAHADGTFIDSNYIDASYLIPVKAGDEIYCSSFQSKNGVSGNPGNGHMNGIRVSYFKEDGTLLKCMSPAEVYEEFVANDLAFLLVPEGAYTMNVSLWNTDKEDENGGETGSGVIYNRSLGQKYRPDTEEQLQSMRATILQEQIQKFADALAQNAKETGQTHKLAMVTFGGGDTGTGRSYQGLYSRHGGVNGLGGYYFTNTGFFVNGTFRNYMEKSHVDAVSGQTFPYYTPLYRDQLDTAAEYYYLKTNLAGITDPATGNLFGVNDGEFRKVTYNSTTNRWVNEAGTNIYCKVNPYDENIQHMFYSVEQVSVRRPTTAEYRDALTSILDESGNFNADVQYALDRYVARGTTHTKYGLAMANNILAQNAPRTYTDALGNEHKGNQVVILFTDGDTNNPAKDDTTGLPTYNTIFDRANDIKDKGAKLYTISVGEAVDLKWMDQISSNYENHKEYDDTLALSGKEYYKNNADISLLEEFFTSITTDIITSQTSVELDETAVMQDYLAEGLVLPEDFSFKNIKVSTVGVTTADEVSYSEIANTRVDFACPAEDVPAVQATGTYSYSYTQNGEAKTKELTVSYDKETGKISVTGFDYAENYVAVNHDGRELIVQITGVEATKDTPTDVLMATNKSSSGILYPTEPADVFYPFPVPQTQLASQVYIMDYAKPMTFASSEWGGTILGIASSNRLKCQGMNPVTTDYGTFQDNGDNTITFNPTTMAWGEAATCYVLCDLGEGNAPDGVTTGDNQWVRVDVVPANNIYYEDDFIKTDTTNGIAYTGLWDMTGTPQNGTENPEGAAGDAEGVHGWEESLKDTHYSDGAAHWGNVDPSKKTESTPIPTAEASFTFIGTGVDIYCRTHNTTGTIVVTLRGSEKGEDGYYKVSKTQIVDNQSVSGDYYQIPTISFMDLTYDTYTVTLYVTTSAKDRYDYYLDGIRFYNPMADDSYYAEKEQNASFTEIRDLLAATTEVNRGAAFIDKTEDEAIGAVKDYDATEYGTYGPKNEVYLAKGQSVTFRVSTAAAYYYVGLKSPNLEAGIVDGPKAVGQAKVSFGTDTVQVLDIAHSTDMYYPVVPNEGGYITIQNNGDGLLSVTKLRIAGGVLAANAEILSIFEEEAVNAVETFAAYTIAGNVAEPEAPVVAPKYPSLSFEDEVAYNIYFTAENIGNLTAADMGMITFQSEPAEGTVADANRVYHGATFNGTYYVVSTDGIPAKNLGDTLYFKTYIKQADGTYIYSDLYSYSAVEYAKDRLANSDNQELKALVVAMLNYGAQAQCYFGYKTDSLMNSFITPEQQAMVQTYDASMVQALTDVPTEKQGSFAATATGFGIKYPSVDFGGAFSINYNFKTNATVDGSVTLYYWNAATYQTASVLTAENADGAVTMTAGSNGFYTASLKGIAAKAINGAVYVAGIYESNGEICTTGVLAYSLGAYCADRIANGSAVMQAFASATAVYGYYADNYFNEREV